MFYDKKLLCECSIRDDASYIIVCCRCMHTCAVTRSIVCIAPVYMHMPVFAQSGCCGNGSVLDLLFNLVHG